MELFSKQELEIVIPLSKISYTNPFTNQRLQLEQQALKSEFISSEFAWSRCSTHSFASPNIKKLQEITTIFADKAREKLLQNNNKISKKHLLIYKDLIITHLYNSYVKYFIEIIKKQSNSPSFLFYKDYLKDYNHYIHILPKEISISINPELIFSIFYQVYRAFFHTYEGFIGGSISVCKLRVAVWQSIFTCDMRRYLRSMHDRMNDITTLITGASGTGKELVARAIAFSHFIPFNSKKMAFVEDYRQQYFPLHLSAMPNNLIESELFGHKRGAYTGALQDRVGWLEACSKFGTVFLDEIGEINESIQVKLLRVLQTREFQRLGETETRPFLGKVIVATNRNLAESMENGDFRTDLYYRICSDLIQTPTLKEQLMQSGELENLVHFLAVRVAGEKEAQQLTEETVTWINTKLEKNYQWLGNVRELEQCVRNILVRGNYFPPTKQQKTDNLAKQIKQATLTAEQLLQLYCKQVYNNTNSYVETAKILNIDRRTVKAKIEAKKQTPEHYIVPTE